MKIKSVLLVALMATLSTIASAQTTGGEDVENIRGEALPTPSLITK